MVFKLKTRGETALQSLRSGAILAELRGRGRILIVAGPEGCASSKKGLFSSLKI
jgi:hypothetical protein